MRIVGVENATPDVGDIHTIDVWYSHRRGAWIVERLDAEGGQIGFGHACVTSEDAEHCLADWLRAHGETHLVGAETTARRKKLRRAA